MSKKMLQAAAGNAAGESLYVEDVFSTYVFTGEGAGTTITNGIDLADAGGLVWAKNRNTSNGHYLVDTTSGGVGILQTSTINGSINLSPPYLVPQSTGYTTGNADVGWNGNGSNMVSWTFRKAEKFFDMQTWTGNSTSGRTIAHDLGSVPACIVVKKTSSSGSWIVYHVGTDASNPEQKYTQLSSTSAVLDTLGTWNDTAPTATEFTIGDDTRVNGSGSTYVAYLFASDAGGFGDDDESIIKCGSYTGTGTVDTLSINLGFEPQWIMVKSATTSQSWYIQDVMRGMPLPTQSGAVLSPNTSASEATNKKWFYPTATGVRAYDNEIEYNQSGQTYIYIAIRRPMKTPESGTEVFAAVDDAGSKDHDLGFSPDLTFFKRTDSTGNWLWYDRLRGNSLYLRSNGSNAEATLTNIIDEWTQEGVSVGSNIGSGDNYFLGNFKRATGFFDVVCRNGTGANATQAHNLAVAPELVITKKRSAVNEWYVTHSFTASGYQRQYLEQTAAASSHLYTDNFVWTARPTASSLFFGSNSNVNQSGQTFVDYLFASVDGVSKVGSYTGTGADLNVDCGFSAGARFILIKRTDSTGDWYVYDSERGIVAGNDPYLLLNTTAAEVTNTDYVDPLSSGFTVTSSAPAALNASGGTYIYLAIA